MNHIKCPSRGSWVRTLLLIFNRVIISLLVIKFFRSETLTSPDSSSLRTLLSIGAWIGFSALMGVWSHLICASKGETKLWKVQTKSVAEAVDTLKISFVSDSIAVVLGLFFLFALNSTFKPNEEDSKVLLGLTVLLVPVIWFFLTPWLYERALSKRKSKTQPKTKPSKKPKQTTPEVADWYVFRSGKVEGPYTAVQLREVQKITARTKVRRGEAVWQRAGEVSELAKFLTDK
jgi:hypothetical protein